MSYRVIRDGVEIGVSPTIVHIFLGDNGALLDTINGEVV